MRPQPRPDAKPPAKVDPLRYANNAPADAPTFATALMEQEVKIVGAHWVHQGCGPVAGQFCRWGDPGCCCATSGFAVDPYGRVFYPNAFRFCVEALDAAGNPVGRIGRYGNVDDTPASGAAAIPFAWPYFVAYADGRLYVSDSINQRVVVVRLDFAAEETCDIH